MSTLSTYLTETLNQIATQEVGTAWLDGALRAWAKVEKSTPRKQAAEARKLIAELQESDSRIIVEDGSLPIRVRVAGTTEQGHVVYEEV